MLAHAHTVLVFLDVFVYVFVHVLQCQLSHRVGLANTVPALCRQPEILSALACAKLQSLCSFLVA